MDSWQKELVLMRSSQTLRAGRQMPYFILRNNAVMVSARAGDAKTN